MPKGFIIAGISSGSGKTTVSCAIARALVKRGFVVQPFKVGPDYIDPGHLSLICSREARNLDVWMMGEDGVLANFYDAMRDADFALVEGVGGLYDGFSHTMYSSTAHVARILNLPVFLVVDIWGVSKTVAYAVKGLACLDDEVDVKGVILNFAGSQRHVSIVARSLKDVLPYIKIIGYIVRAKKEYVPERHLGIRQAAELCIKDYIQVLDEVADTIDIDTLIENAAYFKLPETITFPYSCINSAGGLKVAVASDAAFSFFYSESRIALERSGCKLSFFSPLKGESFGTDVDVLILPGGYPELFEKELMDNSSFRKDLINFFNSGGRIYAECGGLILLSMYNILPFKINFAKRPFLGYARAVVTEEIPFFYKGSVLRGHVFHYSEVVEQKEVAKTYIVSIPSKGVAFEEGYSMANVTASYLHLNLMFCKNFLEKLLS